MTDLLPLYGFVFLGLFSPGPNIILLTASGARFGLHRTWPHIFGVAVGVAITSAITGLGLGAVLLAWPSLRLVLSLIAAGWILYMAYRLWFATAGPAKANDRPFTLVEAVLFQWVNPKIWAVALAAMVYVPADFPPTATALALGHAFGGINLCVCTFWTFAGSLLTYLLSTPRAYRIFMRIMAVMLAASAAIVLL